MPYSFLFKGGVGMAKFKWIEPTEKEIENAVLDWLRLQSGVLAFKVNTIGVYDQRGGFYRKTSKHVMKGTPDILGCAEIEGMPIFFGMEIKTQTGRQSDDQKFFEETLKMRTKGFYFVIRSLKDAELALSHIQETVRVRISSNMSS